MRKQVVDTEKSPSLYTNKKLNKASTSTGRSVNECTPWNQKLEKRNNKFKKVSCNFVKVTKYKKESVGC
jgi:hypothetical protein